MLNFAIFVMMNIKYLRFFLFIFSLSNLTVSGQDKTSTAKTITNEQGLDAIEAASYYNFRKNLTIQSNESVFNRNSLANCMGANNQNIGFESGNFSGWDIKKGVILNSLNDSIVNVSQATTTKTLVTTGFDPISNLSYNSPFAGNQVIKLNDAIINSEATFMSTKFVVTPSNNVLKTAFSLVLQKANHQCSGNPYFRIQLFTCSRTNLIKEYLFLPEDGLCGGYNPAFFNQAVPSSSIGYYYATDWKKVCFDLRNYIGEEVELNVIVADCIFNGHFGYAYFDAEFGSVPANFSFANTFTVNSTAFTFSTGVANQCFNQGSVLQCQNTPTISYPTANGFFVTTPTNSLSLTQQGSYNVFENNVFGCIDINEIKINVKPIITIATPSLTVCPNTINSYTLGGSKSYTVKVNGVVTNYYTNNTVLPIPVNISVTQNPSTITVVGSGGSNICTDSASVVLQVLPVTSLTPIYNPTVCAGNTTLSATGAVTYTWNYGAAYTQTFNASVGGTTNINVVGTDMQGCKTASSNFSLVGIYSTPMSISAPSNNSICLGDSVYVSVVGANSFTWSNGFTGCCQFLKPTLSNPNFTVHASGLCTPTTNFSIPFNVFTGPPVNSFTVNYNNVPVCPNTSFTVQGVGSNFYMKWGATGQYNNLVNAFVTSANPTFTAIALSATNSCGTPSVITMSVLPMPTLAVSGSTNICENQSATLGALGANTYTWDYFQPGPSYTTGTTTTNFNVILAGTNAAGCTSYSTFPVVVENSGIISSPNATNVCIGANVFTLSAQPFATSGTYSWSTGATTQSIVVTPTVTTTYTLIVNSNLCGVKIHTLTIVVNPNFVNPITYTNTPVCMGKTYTVTLNGAASYQVNYGPVFTSNTYTYMQNYTWPGFVIVTGTLSNGCITSTNIVLTAAPNPIISAFGPPGNQGCITSTVNLTAYGASTYTWSSGGTGSVTAVTPSVNTSYSVIGTSTSGCTGTATTPVVFGVNPPTITITPASPSVCPGSLFSLTASATSGNSFLWSDNTNAAVTTNTINMPTVYTVTCSNAYCSSTKTVQVNIHNPVSLSLTPGTLCTGVSNVLSYTAAPAGGTLFVNGMPTNTILTLSPNTYSLSYKYQDTGSCVLKTSTIITVYQTPCLKISASSYSSCVGGQVTFTGSPAGGFFSGSNISGNTLSLPAVGNYTASYTYLDLNNCANTICTEINASICTSLNMEDNDLKMITIFPNPSHNAVTISDPNGGSLRLKIYDISGRLIDDRKLEINSNEIDISGYTNGLYIFYLENNTNRRFIKIIKE